MTALLERSLALWHASANDLPLLAREYSLAEQIDHEKHLDRFLKSIEAELLRLPATRTDRDQSRRRITAAFSAFAKGAVGLADRHLAMLLDGGFSAIGRDLGQQARRFDPHVAATDIIQACRNTWTACGLQALLMGTMRVTPSIFAYSMLYPYSDNYMDDTSIPRQAKLSFSGRFRKRLAGEPVEAANQREETIWRLVALIESEYSRPDFPQVFDGLLAIHQAQEESLRLFGGASGDVPVDVLTLSFAKGGTSVLADAFLAAGSVQHDQAAFAFDWGVLLQLADDLQDVQVDRKRGLLTLFSQAAKTGFLDEPTTRTLHFAHRVMAQLRAFPDPASATLKELIVSSSYSLLNTLRGRSRRVLQPTLPRLARTPFALPIRRLARKTIPTIAQRPRPEKTFRSFFSPRMTTSHLSRGFLNSLMPG